MLIFVCGSRCLSYWSCRNKESFQHAVSVIQASTQGFIESELLFTLTNCINSLCVCVYVMVFGSTAG